MNSVNIIGNLTKEPELRYTPSGKAVTNFTVAVQKKFNKDEANFIPVVAWEHTAKFIANYAKKGTKVGVSGSIQTRSYENEGKKTYIVEILAESAQILTKAETGTNTSGTKNSGQKSQNTEPNFSNNEDPFANSGKSIDIDDSDLPF